MYTIRVAFGQDLCRAIEKTELRQNRFDNYPLVDVIKFFKDYDGEIHEYIMTTEQDADNLAHALGLAQGCEEIHSTIKKV